MPSDLLFDRQFWLAAFVAGEWVVRLTMLVVIPFRRSPDAAKGWLLLIFFEPVLGLLLYLAIGRPRLPEIRVERSQEFLAHADPTLKRLARSPAIYHPETDPAFAPAVRLAEALGDLPILGGNAVEVLTDYETIFARLVADIDAARAHVHLMFYIFGDDAWSARIVAAMERAVVRGVECRVLADSLGSRPAFRRMLPRLAAAGIARRRDAARRFFSPPHCAHRPAQSSQDRRRRRLRRLYGLAQHCRADIQTGPHLRGADGARHRTRRAGTPGDLRRRLVPGNRQTDR